MSIVWRSNYGLIKPMLLFVACAMYGTLSSSTPDEFGVAEGIIAVCLIGVVGFTGAIEAVRVSLRSKANFLNWMKLFFIFLITSPTIYGLTCQNNELRDWVRDIVPLIYAFIPILMIPYFVSEQGAWLWAICLMLCGIGGAFSVRYYMIENVSIGSIGQVVLGGDLNYFPMDPAVTFAAIFALLEALRLYERGSYWMGFGWGLLSIVCLGAIGGMVMRAPLLMYGAIIVIRITMLGANRGSGLFLKLLLLLSLGVLVLLFDHWGSVIQQKFEAVGLNAKDAEIRDLIAYVGSGVEPLLFGTGWGGMFESPAVGTSVRYVHNYMGFYLMKAGLAGLLMACVISLFTYGRLVWSWWKAESSDELRVRWVTSSQGAAMVTLTSSFFLQASYKSLTFGLVLAVAFLSMGLYQASGSRRVSQRRIKPAGRVGVTSGSQGLANCVASASLRR